MNCCVAILVMKMEEKATCLAYYALFKKGKNAAETHTEYLCSVWRRCGDWADFLKWFVKFRAGCFLLDDTAQPCAPVGADDHPVETSRAVMCATGGPLQSACAAGRLMQSHVPQGGRCSHVCRREAAAVTCAAGRPLQSRVPQGGRCSQRVPQGGRCSHVCHREAAAVTCAAGGPLPHSECPDQALRSTCASSVMSITVMFEFLISKEKNLLDHLSTCNSPVKGNKNVLFLKQIVLGDEK